MNDLSSTIEAEDTEAESTSAIIPMPEPVALAVMFRTDKGLKGIIDDIKDKARSEPVDMTTEEGRKHIKATAYKVARMKNALDKAGKALNEEAQKQIKIVNTERKYAWDELEILQAEIRKPVDEWDAKEKDRVAALKDRLAVFDLAQAVAQSTAAELAKIIADVDAVMVDETWQEFEIVAAERKSAALDHFKGLLDIATQREERDRELAALRAEAEARRAADEAREKEAREKAEAAEREAAARQAEIAAREKEMADKIAAQQARLDQIERAAKEAELREAEAKRMESERIEAEKLAAEEAEQNRINRVERIKEFLSEAERGWINGQPKSNDMILHELENRVLRDMDLTGVSQGELEQMRLRVVSEVKQKMERERTERAAEEARKQAEAEEAKREEIRAALAQKAIDDAAQHKADLERAAQAERDRIEAEAKADREAEARRRANAEHLERIKRDISNALAAMKGRASPDEIADALMAGQIPHTTVKV